MFEERKDRALARLRVGRAGQGVGKGRGKGVGKGRGKGERTTRKIPKIFLRHNIY